MFCDQLFHAFPPACVIEFFQKSLRIHARRIHERESSAVRMLVLKFAEQLRHHFELEACEIPRSIAHGFVDRRRIRDSELEPAAFLDPFSQCIPLVRRDELGIADTMFPEPAAVAFIRGNDGHDHGSDDATASGLIDADGNRSYPRCIHHKRSVQGARRRRKEEGVAVSRAASAECGMRVAVCEKSVGRGA